MNVPPAAPAPYIPPPPPPPKKSSALKWILIGCGGLGFIGILVCGGCFYVGYLLVKNLANETVAKVKPIITQNETVKSEIGEVKTLNVVWSGFRTERRNGRDLIHCTLEVEGDKGKGTVYVTLYDRDRDKDEAFVNLTFASAAGKRTPIGTWRVYDDGHGNSGFERVSEPPADAPLD